MRSVRHAIKSQGSRSFCWLTSLPIWTPTVSIITDNKIQGESRWTFYRRTWATQKERGLTIEKSLESHLKQMQSKLNLSSHQRSTKSFGQFFLSVTINTKSELAPACFSIITGLKEGITG